MTTLLERLQANGYEPQDNGPADSAGDWYDLVVSGTGTLRVVIYPHDGYSVDVTAFDKHMIERWSARFLPGVPDSIINGCLDAGEWELARLRGGPVTPAQAASAR